MSGRSNQVCPMEKAGSLDSVARRWLQNPRKILKPYIKEGMTVLDAGCGPGFFSVDMARMVGDSGRVIASDLQEGMLEKVSDKIKGTELERRVVLHKCEEDSIGVSDKVDFVLVFYMAHEVPNQQAFLREIESILEPNGQALIVEPLFHVSKAAFEETVRKAREVGLADAGRPSVFFSRAVLLKKG